MLNILKKLQKRTKKYTNNKTRFISSYFIILFKLKYYFINREFSEVLFMDNFSGIKEMYDITIRNTVPLEFNGRKELNRWEIKQ